MFMFTLKNLEVKLLQEGGCDSTVVALITQEDMYIYFVKFPVKVSGLFSCAT